MSQIDTESSGEHSTVDISIIIPLLNEVETVQELAESVSTVMKTMSRPHEIIFIDDGSSDGTYERLKLLHRDIDEVVVLRFRRNFGQTASLQAGFKQARGEIIITMDGDLQNDPADIPVLVAKLEEGYDLVSGWRKKRKDPFISRRLPSMIANRLISLITGVKLHDYGCTLKAFKSEVVKNIKLYGEMHRFIPAIASWMGISVAEVEVRHHSRKAGKSKYGIFRTFRVVLDLITVKFLLDYSTKPIQMFGLIGLFCTATGVLISLYLAFLKVFKHVSLANRPMLLLAIMLIFIGVQFITMGLLAEFQTRAYHEGQDKPIYVIKDILD